jgi:hypothetical protein
MSIAILNKAFAFRKALKEGLQGKAKPRFLSLPLSPLNKKEAA